MRRSVLVLLSLPLLTSSLYAQTGTKIICDDSQETAIEPSDANRSAAVSISTGSEDTTVCVIEYDDTGSPFLAPQWRG